MKGIKGQLSSLPVTDLMQWIDMNKKSGVLFIAEGSTHTCFCFDEGKLLMAASRSDGMRFGDYLATEGHIGLEAIKTAYTESRRKEISIIGYLMDKKIMPKEFLRVAIQQMAEEIISDILSWQEGTFEFVEELPRVLMDTPIKLSTNFIVFEAVRRFDEINRKQQGE